MCVEQLITNIFKIKIHTAEQVFWIDKSSFTYLTWKLIRPSPTESNSYNYFFLGRSRFLKTISSQSSLECIADFSQFWQSLRFSTFSYTRTRAHRTWQLTGDTCRRSIILWRGSEMTWSLAQRHGSLYQPSGSSTSQQADQQSPLKWEWSRRGTWRSLNTVSSVSQFWDRRWLEFKLPDRKSRITVTSGGFWGLFLVSAMSKINY